MAKTIEKLQDDNNPDAAEAAVAATAAIQRLPPDCGVSAAAAVVPVLRQLEELAFPGEAACKQRTSISAIMSARKWTHMPKPVSVQLICQRW